MELGRSEICHGAATPVINLSWDYFGETGEQRRVLGPVMFFLESIGRCTTERTHDSLRVDVWGTRGVAGARARVANIGLLTAGLASVSAKAE